MDTRVFVLKLFRSLRRNGLRFTLREGLRAIKPPTRETNEFDVSRYHHTYFHSRTAAIAINDLEINCLCSSVGFGSYDFVSPRVHPFVFYR